MNRENIQTIIYAALLTTMFSILLVLDSISNSTKRLATDLARVEEQSRQIQNRLHSILFIDESVEKDVEVLLKDQVFRVRDSERQR